MSFRNPPRLLRPSAMTTTQSGDPMTMVHVVLDEQDGEILLMDMPRRKAMRSWFPSGFSPLLGSSSTSSLGPGPGPLRSQACAGSRRGYSCQFPPGFHSFTCGASSRVVSLSVFLRPRCRGVRKMEESRGPSIPAWRPATRFPGSHVGEQADVLKRSSQCRMKRSGCGFLPVIRSPLKNTCPNSGL